MHIKYLSPPFVCLATMVVSSAFGLHAASPGDLHIANQLDFEVQYTCYSSPSGGPSFTIPARGSAVVDAKVFANTMIKFNRRNGPYCAIATANLIVEGGRSHVLQKDHNKVYRIILREGYVHYPKDERDYYPTPALTIPGILMIDANSRPSFISIPGKDTRPPTDKNVDAIDSSKSFVIRMLI